MRLTVTAPMTFAWEDLAAVAPGPGEVRVRTHLSALSVSSELAVAQRGPFPAALGDQTLGVVDEAGANTALQPGTRVITTLGHAAWGLHPEGRVIPIPAHVPDPVALCAVLGEETHKGLRKVAPHPGEQVLVAGAGLLGLLTVFNLTRRGFEGVTVLEPQAERRRLALTFGAAQACAPGTLPHDAFDVGVDCSASPAGFAELMGHLRPRGRCAVLADGNWGALTLPPAFHTRELQLVTSSDGEDYAAYARWLWHHPESLLAGLFPVTVHPAQLPALYPRLLTSDTNSD
ncbi:theronine dehydrogenase [Deinococcus arcticus]|uniref:Theronine dehydrogenase n=1 Tax=Deinococcus arcticus TaxID=2136176 RepID=A0A2T3W5T5_9DEIO|nr:theronine dehydrogenase [Deinococcus arcticus]PTA67255.1 theronine dehydrogenase [Deinococcus arcticus]